MAVTQGLCEKYRITALLKAMLAVADHFTRRLILPPASQLRSSGPKIWWAYNHRCSRGELRIAAQAAMRMKTVVGMPGTTAPIKPSITQMSAKAMSK